MSAAENPSPRITVLPDAVSEPEPNAPDTAVGPSDQKMKVDESAVLAPSAILRDDEDERPPSLESDSRSHSLSAALSLESEPQREDDAPQEEGLVEENKGASHKDEEGESCILGNLPSASDKEIVDEIPPSTFSSESEVVQTIPQTEAEGPQSNPPTKTFEARVAEQWWPSHKWQEGAQGESGFLRVTNVEGCGEQEVLSAPLEPFFVLTLPSPKTADFQAFPLLKTKDSRVWDDQLLRRMQHLFPSLLDSPEVWLTSGPEWRLLASALFFMATCKSYTQTAREARTGSSGDDKVERRIVYFSQCLGLEKKVFVEQVQAAEREMRDDGMDGEACFYSAVLELGPKDAGWSSRMREAVNRRYKVGFTSSTENAEVLAFLRVAARGFQFVQNPLTAAHEALAYHPALACLRATVPQPKVFPRASAKGALGCVEWFVEAGSGLLVLYSNQRLDQHDRLLWSASRFLPFDELNLRWSSSVATKVDETEAGQTSERQLLPLTLLFQTCRLSVFKPYHALDHFITDPAEHALSEPTVQQLVVYALNPENMDLLRCKVPSLGTEIVQESLFASLYLRCCLYVCFAVWVHRKGVGGALAEMLRHHPVFADRWKQTGREAKNEVLRLLSKKRAAAKDLGASGHRNRGYASRQKNGAAGAGAEFLADALLFALEDQFTELCFLLFPPQGSYLSDQLGNDVLLKFASLAQKCRLLRVQRLQKGGATSREELKHLASSSSDKYLFLVEVRENLLVKSSKESETGASEEEEIVSSMTTGKQKTFVRWGV